MKSAIQHVETHLCRVPLAEVLSGAMHGAHTHFEPLTTSATRADGGVASFAISALDMTLRGLRGRLER